MDKNKADSLFSPPQTPRKTPHKSTQKLLNSASKLPRRSPRILHRTPPKLEKAPSKSPAAKQSAAKCLGKYFSCPVQGAKSPSLLRESKRVPLLQVTPEDCTLQEKPSPPYKEAALQMPEHDEASNTVNSSLPHNNSNPLGSSPSALQESFLTELRTPRCSLRSFSKLSSPAGTQRLIFPSEIRVQPEALSQATESTPRKLEDSGSKLPALPASPLTVEMSELTVKLQSPFSSPLCAAAISSPSHVQAGESHWDLAVPKTSLLKSPGIAGSLPKSPLNASKQGGCEPDSGGGDLTARACETPSRNKDSHRDNGDSSCEESLQLSKSQIPENTPVSEKNKPMGVMAQNSSPGKDPENVDERSSPKLPAGECALSAETECEQVVKEGNSSASTCESFLSSSQTSSDELEARSLLREEYTRAKALSLRRRSRCALSTSPPLPKSAPAYSLRCTADRRQREAAARMGNPELPAKFSTPKSRRKAPSASPPTYEVELEMQASGLPKLRIKKISSCSALEVQPEASASKPKGGESPFGDLATASCSKHPGKLAAACVSPSCFRAFHSTPGKGGGQTYICQSCTPTSCASNATSPSPLEAEVPQTPSPKLKGKSTPDAIKDWPRRRRAAGSTANAGSGRNEKNADERRMSAGREGEVKVLERCSSRVISMLGEFELEGICRLQDQASPPDSDPRAEESFVVGTFGLKSRKRTFTSLSPEKEENHEAKRTCSDKHNSDPCVFSPDEGNRSKSRTDSVLSEKPRACSLLTPVQPSCMGDDDVFLLSGN